MGFSTKNKGITREHSFIRSKKDNKLLPSMQVKDLLSITTPDCVNVIDSDSIAYKTASSCEEDYIEVTNLSDSSVETFKNITEFKGNLRTEGAIKADSYLGILNIKREAHGVAPLALSDFKIEPKKKLKFEKGVTIDGRTFNNSLEVCKYYMDEWISAIKIQTQIPNVLLVLGHGLNHRHDILLPHQYKSDRTSNRPLLLEDARNYLLTQYPSEMAQVREEGVSRGLEADERVDEYGFMGYLHYRKTGKFSYIKSAIDKDSHNPCGIVFDYTKDFHFANPQPWLVEHRDVCTGEIELCKNKVKGFGLKHSVMQIILEDLCDEYSSRKYLPPEMKKGISYGAASFYKDFVNLDSPTEILQKMVDIFGDWFKGGLQYTAWDGTEINEDTLTWLNKCFLCMYMRLKKDDPTQVIDWLNQYEVDYTKLINNHKPTAAPLQEEQVLRDELEALKSGIATLIEETTPTKSAKKQDQVDKLEATVEKLKNLLSSLDNFYVLDHTTPNE